MRCARRIFMRAAEDRRRIDAFDGQIAKVGIPRKLISKLARSSTPRSPSPSIHSPDQHSTNLWFTPQTDPPTSELASVRTLTIYVKTKLVPNKARANDKAPDFRVYAGGAELGAAWRVNGKGKEKKPHLSVLLDDPSFGAPIRAAFKGCALIRPAQGGQDIGTKTRLIKTDTLGGSP